MNSEPKLIVFYDGECPLCQRSIQFILKHEKNSALYFSSLQSDFTRQFFTCHLFSSPTFSTFYFYKEGRLYSKSSAAIQLSNHLQFPYPFLQIGLLIPKFIRDFLYDLIAKNRHKFFRKSCQLSLENSQNRFLN